MTRLHEAARAYREAHREYREAHAERERAWYDGEARARQRHQQRIEGAVVAYREAERALLAAALEEET